MHDITDFSSAKFHEIWVQHVDGCRHENYRNRIFFSKNAKDRHFFQRFAISGRYSSAMITDRRKFIVKNPSRGCVVSTYTVGIN